ncbi:hypothetical protein AMECASPLE_032757 [Ameca splendens]|uniref:Uncharacterized protein n=1 Tax=Ameca splendens TaxID=208324 RepID=A0ABV1A322_9TELE
MIHCGSKRFGQAGAAMADHSGKSYYVSHSGRAPKMKVSDPSMISKLENLQSRRVFTYLFFLSLYCSEK